MIMEELIFIGPRRASAREGATQVHIHTATKSVSSEIHAPSSQRLQIASSVKRAQMVIDRSSIRTNQALETDLAAEVAPHARLPSITLFQCKGLT